jgi:anti-sigma factor RsiW
MSHLTLEQLVQLREPGLEPGVSGLRSHLESCAACQAEAARLDQRANRLRALAALRPARDHWPALAAQLRAERRRRTVRGVAWMALAAAAGFVLMVTIRSARQAPDPSEQTAINEAIARSRQLEQVIHSYNPEARVTDGRTVRVAGELEDRIALVDQQLQSIRQLDARTRDSEMLGLWRQRVGLLNALVDVHMTRAGAVGY